MIPVADFHAYVLPYAPGCSTVAASRALIDSAIEFCRASYLLDETAEAAVVAGSRSVSMVLADPALVPCWLMSARWNGADLEPATPDQLDAERPDWRTASAEAPRFVVGSPGTPGTLLLTPAPTADGVLQATFAIAPARATRELPDVLLEEWAEGIASGALRRLLSMPSQPYSDPAAATAHGVRFAFAVDQARLVASERQTRGRSVVKRVAFGSR